DHALAQRLSPTRVPVGLAAREHDLRDRHRLRIDAARGKRCVRGRLLERRHRLGAERDGGEGGELRRSHAELARHVDDVLLTAVIARIAPVRGSIDTTAAAGSVERSSVFAIAAVAARCRPGRIVVYTFSPPSRTVFVPYSRCSRSSTYPKK